MTTAKIAKTADSSIFSGTQVQSRLPKWHWQSVSKSEFVLVGMSIWWDWVVEIFIWCGWVVAKSGRWLFPPQTLPISQAFVGTPRTSPAISTSLLLIIMMVIMMLAQNFSQIHLISNFLVSWLIVLFSFVKINRLVESSRPCLKDLSLNHKRRSAVIRPGSTPVWGFGLHWAQTVKWGWAVKSPWQRNKDLPTRVATCCQQPWVWGQIFLVLRGNFGHLK